MIKCGWCGTNYVNWKSHCDSCGGPLPALPGMALGTAPPPAPRSLPKGFAFRQRWSGNIATIVGAMFGGIGGLLTLIFLIAMPLAALIPLIFLLIGFFMFRYGWRQANCVLKAFKEGVAAEGKVAEIRRDTSQSINGVHPWLMKYHFQVGEHLHEGCITSWDSTVGERSKGQPLWVLYSSDDPGESTIYPPVK